MKPFRELSPKRTYKGTKTDYHDYKPFLAEDFHHRCGYTDCSDIWFGGKNNFHIDHFRPWKGEKNGSTLKTDYNNLVYCCSYVNILKSDKKGPFSDPCKVDYNKLFYRDDMGRIFPVKESDSAIYMFYQMRLYMARYAIIWLLDQLHQRMTKISEIMKKSNNPAIAHLMADLYTEYTKYKEDLSKTL